eukprot:Amastigsp_a846474_38.p4 type:complete len:127 gc:universal Amastigsp_a846474_38:643-263(-)
MIVMRQSAIVTESSERPFGVGMSIASANAMAPRSPANQRNIRSGVSSWYSVDRNRFKTSPSGKMCAARATTMAMTAATVSQSRKSWLYANTENPSEMNTKVSHMYEIGWNACAVASSVVCERLGRM